MKSFNKTSLAILLGAMMIEGCTLPQMVKMAKDQKLTVNPSPLELHGDSVVFDMSAQLPLKMLKKNKVYTVNTYYKYGNQKMDLGKLEFNGNNFPNAKTQQPSLSKKYSFAYKPEIPNGDVVVVGSASNAAMTKAKTTPEMPVAKGIITTSRLVKDVNVAVYAEHGYNNKEEYTPNKVEFYFEQKSAKLKVKETKGNQGKFIDAFVPQKSVTKMVSVVGEHSPEGREIINAKLSDNRANAIVKFYKERLVKLSKAKKAKDKKMAADSVNFVTKGIIQDWSALKSYFDTSAVMSSSDEADVLSVVNSSTGTFQEKERQLHSKPYYKTLFQKVYPKLRTARTEILTIKPKKTDEQILTLAKVYATGGMKTDTLRDDELAYAGTLTTDLKEKEGIYMAATKKSGSWVAHNNLGAVYVEMAIKSADKNTKLKMLDAAENQFNLSLKAKNNAEAHTNLAQVHLMRGAKVMGLDEVSKSTMLESNDNVKKSLMAVKGALEIKNAQYESAVQSLTKTPENYEVLFDLALAYTLKKDYSNAQATINSALALNSEDVWGHYLAAIVAARQKDNTKALTHIKNAVAKDRTIIEKAKTDLEFVDFWSLITL
jgi:tetratricopeptide (TPR) repeat protein